ncbi:TAT-variant-translocated molybdopterin oxidoreductase [Maribacter stanieri]|jgi:molybdopterin-containing oxidoreductase family iron-sulfur binding subunit|uniref:Quinol:cytochrome c oxidoreductase iron-sulfur protein n=1 Tax=Maribacter stanieri TaxID=440514 RepID=A0A1I6I9J8_9FLAO|nr:TAT-variant-translocated molybdopterin oxidoreductase [Maribacter stanieri]SFR63318.1 quinol:cytochrome c oxidoreductase iron-sulfur protein precursor [Maribacter stanieri]
MASNKKYWKNEAELNPNDSIVEALKQNEFVEQIPVDDFLGDKETLSSTNTNRRDFLKYVGFSTAAASLAACEGPVVKSIPYVVLPENIVPGVANYYATTVANGFDFASILIKTREGRPIKVENNTLAKIGGSANARIQGSVLSLYDSTRLQGPMANGEPVEWDVLKATVKAKMGGLKGSAKKIAILTQTYASPSTDRLMADLVAANENVVHVTYDAISEDAALNAFENKYGERALADYDFEKADLIVSFGADFIADWQGGGYDAGYSRGRVPKNGKMSRHVQLEANMSLTGANADKRVAMKPSAQKVVLAKLYGKLNGTSVGGNTSEYDVLVDSIAAEIKKAGSNAVVVTGLDDVNAQAVVLAINEMLSSKAFDTAAPKYIRKGSVKAVNALIADMKAGRVGALLMDGVNPVYSLPNAADFKEGLAKVDLTVAFSTNWNETTEAVQYVGATNHYLESWGDVQIKKGHYSLMQPTIKELFDTKQFQTVVLELLGSEQSYYDYIKDTWSSSVLNGANWNQALQDGVFSADTMVVNEEGAAQNVVASETPTEVVANTSMASAIRSLANTTSEGMELTLYSKVGMGDGQQASNPWLQEFPDPITRVSWDNYVTISKADAVELGVENVNVANGGMDGNYVKLTVNGVSLEKVPVVVQPGQAKGTVGLSFGYGKKVGLKEDMQTGVNAFALYDGFNANQSVSVEKVAGNHEFACIQLHKTLMGRGDIIKETTLEIFNTKNHSEWNEVPMVSLDHQEVPATSVDLWDSFDRTIGHHFNMSIDLNACTGCGSCVIACHAENNVPVVGKAEVRKSRDMHWLRIDRYYSSEETFEGDNQKKDGFDGLSGDNGSLGGFGELEDPSANPQVAFQPVMCQHCNHAPCETVCPVAATSHGRQGQNQMAYNRCVGTRYCANNCPYKVRRFNWFLYNNNDEFDFHMNNDLGKMVLNPDVNVRSRGVIEKCSMCIQKTQKTILDAKRDGRVIEDGEFQTACSSACSNGAIVFGDVNDEKSKVAELKASDRMYHLLEHVGTQPNVFYHVKVRNTNEA